MKQSAYNVWQQAIAAQTIAQKTYQRVENLYQQGVATEQKRDEAKAAKQMADQQEKNALVREALDNIERIRIEPGEE